MPEDVNNDYDVDELIISINERIKELEEEEVKPQDKEDTDKFRIPDALNKMIENSDQDNDISADDSDDNEFETENKSEDNDDEEEYFDISDLLREFMIKKLSLKKEKLRIKKVSRIWNR